MSINEFVQYYHEEYTTLSQEIEDLELRVKDQENRAVQIESRLQEMIGLEKAS